MARKIFFSYNYEKDGKRIDEIRNMGVVKDIKPATKEEWDKICSEGDASIKKWIDDKMKDADCVVVFIGEELLVENGLDMKEKRLGMKEKDF